MADIANKQKIFTTNTWDEFSIGILGLSNKSKLTNIAYGTCSTAAATVAKEITISNNYDWKLEVGSIIIVKFSETNSAKNPTFNVNNTGAKSIWYNTAKITTSSLGYAGTANRPMMFMYDGTNYVFISWSYDTNSTYSNVSLGQGYATQNNTASATAITATLASYALSTGGIVAVKFTYSVPASATLNINSKGAKAIYYKGAAITADVIKAGDTAILMYNGTYYHLLSIDRWQEDIVSAKNHADSTHARTDATKVEASSTNGKIKINGTETTVYTHPTGTNPHGTTKSDVGLGNVPNVATNNQTPTYTQASTLANLTSGEKLSVSLGKIMKAISDLISHLADNVKHITSTERTNWNAAKTHADSAHVKVVELTQSEYNALVSAGTVDSDTTYYITDDNDILSTDIVHGNSNVGAVLDSKQDAITGGATTILSSNLTASRALVSNSSGKVAVSAVTSTELGYLDGVTSAIQTQLNAKQATITTTNLTGKSKAIATATVGTITSTSLAAGTYLVLGSATVPSASSATADGRKICISTSSTSFNNSYAAGCLGSSSFATSLNCWALLTLTATTTVYLLGYHGAGSQQTITDGRLTAIKLA